MMSQLDTINNAIMHNIIPAEIYKTNEWNKVLKNHNVVMEDEIEPGCWWNSHKVKVKLPKGWKWSYNNPLLVLVTEKGYVVFSQYYGTQQLSR